MSIGIKAAEQGYGSGEGVEEDGDVFHAGEVAEEEAV